MSKFNNLVNSVNPKQLFLFDSFGALVSALMLGFILPTFESIFGMPKETLYLLALIPVPFFIYSFMCFLFYPKKWSPYLKIIAVANLLYCVLTFSLLFVEQAELTVLGNIYFIGEIIIIVTLAVFELKVAGRD